MSMSLEQVRKKMAAERESIDHKTNSNVLMERDGKSHEDHKTRDIMEDDHARHGGDSRRYMAPAEQTARDLRDDARKEFKDNPNIEIDSGA
jgi:hypothetical protein